MKKKLLIILIVILLIVIIGILILVNSSIGKEALAKRDIRKLTKTFYSYYYDENNYNNGVKDFLKKYTGSGLTITLGNMEVYIEEKSNSGTTYKSLEKCDRAKSKIIIYPKDPFNKDDYELKFDLLCN